MKTELIFRMISVFVVFLFSGILIFINKDKVSQGIGILVSIATITALIAEYVSLNLAFVILFYSVIIYIIYSTLRKSHGSDQ